MHAEDFQMVLVLTVFLLSDARALPDGAPWGAANPAADQNCAACHFSVDPVLASDDVVIRGLP